MLLNVSNFRDLCYNLFAEKLVRRPRFLLTFLITVPRFTTAATRFQCSLLLVTSRTLPLQRSRLTIYLMTKLIATFALPGTIICYTASVTVDLGSRCRTYSITAPTLISLEHCRRTIPIVLQNLKLNCTLVNVALKKFALVKQE